MQRNRGNNITGKTRHLFSKQAAPRGWKKGFSLCWSGGCAVLEQQLRGAGATLAIPHIQGQRRSPRKMVGGAESPLESNPIPARDAQRAQTNLMHTRTQRPHRDQDRTVFECLLWRYGSAVDCRRGRGSGCIRLGYGISPLGGGHH